jgi:hypothetical protein
MTTAEKIKKHKEAVKLLTDLKEIERMEYLTSGIDELYCQQKKADLEKSYDEILDTITEKVF